MLLLRHPAPCPRAPDLDSVTAGVPPRHKNRPLILNTVRVLLSVMLTVVFIKGPRTVVSWYRSLDVVNHLPFPLISGPLIPG